MSIRSRIARRMPAVARKFVRMAEHYVRRHKQWFHVLSEMRGQSLSDTFVLWASAGFSPITSLKDLDSYQSPVLLRDIGVNIPSVGKFNIRRGTDDIIHILTAREPEVREFIENNLQDGDCFVDAGANIGFFSVLAQKKVANKGKVIAIEMIPPTAEILRHHLASNSCNCSHVVENALSDSVGQSVQASCNSAKYGQASIVEKTEDATRSEHYQVETTTLDVVLKSHEHIKIMKMDLEGAEILALAGCNESLEKIQNIVFESNGRDNRVRDFLCSRGFVVTHVDGNNFLASRK